MHSRENLQRFAPFGSLESLLSLPAFTKHEHAAQPDSRSDRQPKFDNDPTEFFVCLHAGASELTF
jgi:hypothetical protein